jgi:hypothetical protein
MLNPPERNMPENYGNDTSGRIDRIEGILEKLATHQLHAQEFFEREHKQLLTAQIVLTDRLDRLTVRVDKLALTQEDTADKLNVLIALIDQQQRERGTNPSA